MELTQEKRYRILAMREPGFGASAIDRKMHQATSTVSRELQRHTEGTDYDGALF